MPGLEQDVMHLETKVYKLQALVHELEERIEALEAPKLCVHCHGSRYDAKTEEPCRFCTIQSVDP